MPRIVLHLAFWLLYLSLNAYVEIALAGSTFSVYPLWKRIGIGLAVEVMFLPAKIGATYLMLYQLLPQLLQPEGRRSGIMKIGLLVSLAAFVNIVLLYGAVFPLIYGEAISWERLSFGRFIWSFIDVISIVGLAAGLKFFRLRLESAEREKHLIKEKLESELRFLRTQTNPHFLFNVLNSIYALARKKDDRTEDTILRLSKLLRFMIYECNAQTIPLSKEQHLIKDYLCLEEVRFQDRLQLTYTEDIDKEGYEIPPLLLLPLVENAFKHGVSESRFMVSVKLHLEVIKGMLHFRVFNSLEGEGENEIDTGIGLENLSRQLTLLFPDRHQLNIRHAVDYYQVDLSINLFQ